MRAYKARRVFWRKLAISFICIVVVALLGLTAWAFLSPGPDPLGKVIALFQPDQKVEPDGITMSGEPDPQSPAQNPGGLNPKDPVAVPDIAPPVSDPTPDPGSNLEEGIDFQSASSAVQTFSGLNSKNALLIRLSDGKILLDIGGDQPIYPASMSKIMTAIVAIEQITDMGDKVVLSQKMFDNIYAQNASVAGFLPGEEVPLLDLLYGVLLPSGADASIGLAEYLCGDELSFVALMNEKAKELKMENTQFTNVCGLHSSEHYTTLHDMARLLAYACKNTTFYEIFTQSRHAIQPTNLHEEGITVHSTLFSRMESPDFEGGQILGGKTGYTSAAGLCLASIAEKNGEQYMLITAGAPGTGADEPLHILDAFSIYQSELAN